MEEEETKTMKVEKLIDKKCLLAHADIVYRRINATRAARQRIIFNDNDVASIKLCDVALNDLMLSYEIICKQLYGI